MEKVVIKKASFRPSNNTYQICRLCLKLTKSSIVMSNWVMCVLKDYLPNLVLDITESPHKTCVECFLAIRDFSSFVQVWRASQNTLMGAYLNKECQVNLNEFKQHEHKYTNFKTDKEKAKMFTNRDGMLEMYKNPRVYEYFSSQDKELCDTMLFVLDVNRRLLPVSNIAHLPRNIVLVPDCDIFNEMNSESKTYLIKITRDPLVESDGYAFVYINSVKEQFSMIIKNDFIAQQLTEDKNNIDTQLQIKEEIEIKEEPLEYTDIEPEVKKIKFSAPINEHRLNKEGYIIDDHDYLAMPYKNYGILSGDLIYCSLCDQCHKISEHETHMGVHLTLKDCKEKTCSFLHFHNVYQSALHHSRHKTKPPEIEIEPSTSKQKKNYN